MTARVCGKDTENVLFAVLHFTANASITACVCGKGEVNVPLAVLRVKANIFYYRMRLRQKRQTCRYWHYIALYAYVEPYLTMGCTAPYFPRPTN